MSPFFQSVRDARRTSTPLLAIPTLDPSATMRRLQDAVGDGVVVQWDLDAGLQPRTDRAESVLTGADAQK